jgi:ubiquinone/menaquinone biosynthesis C-methylase UbiE
MPDFDTSILLCPVTGENLVFLPYAEATRHIENVLSQHAFNGPVTGGFVNESRSYFFPVFNEIVLLLPAYALFIGKGIDGRGAMAFDKERVFNYYNAISYDIKNNLKVYEDSPKWVDYRRVSADYVENSFTRAGKYLSQGGRYFLDVASGPIGLPEYMALSEPYEFRICVDISLNALLEARKNYKRKGIFLCADITNIPLKENVCDAVLCQHTLYHVPKNEQKLALHELYRVAKSGTNIAIVYSLFYHSWFMNLTLMPVQLYRIARHVAGKVYARWFSGKPRLYYYPHSLAWFRKHAPGGQMNFYCWRSVNKYFLNIFIHGKAGSIFLSWLRNSEDAHPKCWAHFGEYPLIVITKQNQ